MVYQHQVGRVLLGRFGGEAVNLIEEACGSANTLGDLLTRHFPGFQDHAVYRLP